MSPHAKNIKKENMNTFRYKNHFAAGLATGLLILISIGCVTERASDDAEQRQIEKQKDLKSVDELVTDAQVLFSLGKYDIAEKVITDVIEQKPADARYHMLQADIRFMQCKINEAIESYDEVIRLKPDQQPFMWQRGLALYYAERFADGKAQFESHQTVNKADVENAVWHLMCSVKAGDSVETARKNMIPIEGDARIPMPEIYEVFAGRMNPDQVVSAAAESDDIQRSLYYSFLYNGLYYEMIGEQVKSIEAIEKATKAMSSASKDQLMNQLAAIHLKLRDSGRTEPDNSK